MATDRSLCPSAEVQCKICGKSEPSKENFIAACACEGNLKYAHRKCLDEQIIMLYEAVSLLHRRQEDDFQIVCDVCNERMMFEYEAQHKLVTCQQLKKRISHRKYLFVSYIFTFIIVLAVCSLVTARTYLAFQNRDISILNQSETLAYLASSLFFLMLLNLWMLFFAPLFLLVKTITVSSLEEFSHQGKKPEIVKQGFARDSKMFINRSLNAIKKETENMAQANKSMDLKPMSKIQEEPNVESVLTENAKPTDTGRPMMKRPRDSNVLRMNAGFQRTSTQQAVVLKSEDLEGNNDICGSLRIHMSQSRE